MFTRTLSTALLLTTLTWVGCVVETAPTEPSPQPTYGEDTSQTRGSATPTRRTEDVLTDATNDRPYVDDVAPAPRGAPVVVAVNRGQGGGIKEGDTYDVFALEDEMVDPDTGESLGFSELKVGRIQITRTLAKYSKSDLIGGAARKGDICRPAEGDTAFNPHPGTSTSKSKRKASLAIAPFTFHLNARRTPGTELETGAFTQKFVTTLVKTNKFDVVERSRVDTLLKEIAFSDAGFTDPKRAIKAGKMLGADYFLMGEISVWTHTTRVNQIPRTTRFFRQTELRLIVDMRIVDSRTTKIVAAEKGDVSLKSKTMFKDRPSDRVALDKVQLDKITRDCVADLTRKVIDAVYPLKVISVSGQAAPTLPPPPPADTTAPRISFVSPAQGARLEASPALVEVAVTDDRQVSRVTINGKEAAGRGGRYSARVGLREGQNTISAEAWDAAGNTSSAAVGFSYTRPDATAPQIKFLSHKEGATLTESPIVVKVSVTDDRGVSRVTLNGKAVSGKNGRYSIRVNPKPGPFQVRAKAWDAAGNESAADLTLRYAPDTQAPVVKILAPRNGQAINSVPINVVAQVSDDRDVAKVLINGVVARRDAKGRYVVSITKPHQGPNGVQVQAWDSAGNKGEARSRFAFDATPPEVQANATILVEGRVDDLGATLTINGVGVKFDKDGKYSARVKADPANPGTVVIVAVDEFGNKSREVRKVR